MKKLLYDPFNIDSEQETADAFNYFREESPVLYNNNYKAWMIFGYEDVKNLISDYNNASSRYSTNYKNNDIDIYIYPRLDPPEFNEVRRQSASLYKEVFNSELQNYIKKIINFDNVLNIDIDLINFIDNMCSKIFLKILDVNTELYLEFKQLSYEFLKQQNKNYKNNQYNILNDFYTRNNAKYSYLFNMSVMVGGFATMSGAVISLIRDYIQNKELSHPSNYSNFIQESLRMSSIYSYVTRTAFRDIKISNTTIPEGSTITLLIGSANRDIKRFGENSNNFNTNREYDKINLCFGNGVHKCLGMSINLYVMEEILKNVSNYDIKINNIKYSKKLNRVGYQFEEFNVRLNGDADQKSKHFYQ